jgi:hypothetical protein
MMSFVHMLRAGRGVARALRYLFGMHDMPLPNSPHPLRDIFLLWRSRSGTRWQAHDNSMLRPWVQLMVFLSLTGFSKIKKYYFIKI